PPTAIVERHHQVARLSEGNSFRTKCRLGAAPAVGHHNRRQLLGGRGLGGVYVAGHARAFAVDVYVAESNVVGNGGGEGGALGPTEGRANKREQNDGKSGQRPHVLVPSLMSNGDSALRLAAAIVNPDARY